MQVEYKGFSPVLPDNDRAYFSLLEGVIESLDPTAEMSVTRGTTHCYFRIIPSTSLYLSPLITELIQLHTLLSLHMEMSKSMKASNIISYSIVL